VIKEGRRQTADVAKKALPATMTALNANARTPAPQGLTVH
jgi:hypothetical protein